MTLRRYISTLVAMSVMILWAGCIKDECRNCAQRLEVSFYSRSMCQNDVGYPAEIEDLLICIFDDDGKLVEYSKTDGVVLTADYVRVFNIRENGLYYVAAWSGVDETVFDVNELEAGVTERDDLLFRLQRQQIEATSLDGRAVYFGWSRAVYVPEPGATQKADKAYVNMLEVTNRISVVVEGIMADLDQYSITIETTAASMNVDGSIAGDELINYAGTVSFENGILSGDFTTLKLETGFTNTLVITNETRGTELFRGSLLGTLLLKNPNVNIECDNDYTIKFTAKDTCNCGTYAIAEIWVNDWLVQSYDIGM